MLSTLTLPLETPALDLFAQVGVIKDGNAAPEHLKLFAQQADQQMAKVRGLAKQGEINRDQAVEFQQLILDAAARVLCHPHQLPRLAHESVEVG